MFPGKQRRGVRRYGQQEGVLRTTSASSFEHRRSRLSISSLYLFTRGFRTLPSTKPPKLMSILSFQPSRLWTGEVLTNPKAQISMGMRTSCKAAQPTYISPSSTCKPPLPSVPRRFKQTSTSTS
ncbi:uncharacterized protein ARMOST_17788 [Armillaria ostoyae]|uniref:Uncharacterized protein n=1 Tax=Armillaria ostoyae TaxID=47428 RepID=A0A284S003_ARMOS|nr:uncharacterized protein ARMOST_17788 [Armillaria ostoyae]